MERVRRGLLAAALALAGAGCLAVEPLAVAPPPAAELRRTALSAGK